jgi:hypothetical protein
MVRAYSSKSNRGCQTPRDLSSQPCLSLPALEPLQPDRVHAALGQLREYCPTLGQSCEQAQLLALLQP